MKTRSDYIRFRDILNKYNIKKLYHFTDASNLESIVKNGGLFSWGDCLKRNIIVNRPGGSDMSHEIDARQNLQYYTRICFCKNHPMMYVAMKDGRIQNPVILEIDTDVLYIEGNIFSNKNAARTDAHKGSSYEDFCKIHFETVIKNNQFELDENETDYFQAEILVNSYIPIYYILNINDYFQDNKIKILNYNNLYSISPTGNNPQAIVFLINQSYLYKEKAYINGLLKSKGQEICNIINSIINNLIKRTQNFDKNKYEIACLGYGNKTYNYLGNFNSNKSFYNLNDLENIESNTIDSYNDSIHSNFAKENVWIKPKYDEDSNLLLAFNSVNFIIKEWIQKHPSSNPPIVLHITGNGYNYKEDPSVIDLAKQIKTLNTQYGYVLLINIIFSSEIEEISFPQSVFDLGKYTYGEKYYLMSSVLPKKYKRIISKYNNNTDENSSHSGLIFGTNINNIHNIINDIISINS